MIEEFFSVVGGGCVLGDHLSLELALVFVKALFQEYQLDPDQSYTIVRSQGGADD